MSPEFLESSDEFVLHHGQGRTALVLWFWSVEVLCCTGLIVGLVLTFSGNHHVTSKVHLQGLMTSVLSAFGILGAYVHFCVFKAVLMMRDRISRAAKESNKDR